MGNGRNRTMSAILNACTSSAGMSAENLALDFTRSSIHDLQNCRAIQKPTQADKVDPAVTVKKPRKYP